MAFFRYNYSMVNQISLNEEYSLNAWPALQTVFYDGWVLRFARGYTRRANSINPLYPSSLPTRQKIEACEKIYLGQGLDVTFKLTPASQPEGLDALLDERGYQREADTSVQTLDLAGWTPGPAPEVSLAPAASDEWLAAFWRMSATRPEHQATHRQMLQSIIPDTCYASLDVDGQAAAVGLAVLQDGWIGFFDIVTDPARRRQGQATRVKRSLLGWGKSQGAHTAYLQVVLKNQPALNLYANLGFHEAYAYWYRVKKAAQPGVK